MIQDNYEKLIHNLEDLIEKYYGISDVNFLELTEKIPLKDFSKGTILQRQGDFTQKCFFVITGCIRQYYYDRNAKEHTLDFFTEGHFFTSSGVTNTKSNFEYNLICSEKTTVIWGNGDLDNRLCKEHPNLKEINLSIIEQSLLKTRKEFALFKSSTLEERYQYLLDNRPELLDRVPQHQIASYLGTTPETLSRVKRKIFRGNLISIC